MLTIKGLTTTNNLHKDKKNELVLYKVVNAVKIIHLNIISNRTTEASALEPHYLPKP